MKKGHKQFKKKSAAPQKKQEKTLLALRPGHLKLINFMKNIKVVIKKYLES